MAIVLCGLVHELSLSFATGALVHGLSLIREDRANKLKTARLTEVWFSSSGTDLKLGWNTGRLTLAAVELLSASSRPRLAELQVSWLPGRPRLLVGKPLL